MDIEITPDQPKFCPRCHGEMSPLTVGAMARHDLHLPPRPVDPVKAWERAMGWRMVLPAVLAAMFAVAGYCAELPTLKGGPISLKSAVFLSGAATLLLGLAVRRMVVRRKRRGAEYLEYESALQKWHIEMESFQRLRICAACQVIVDDKESIPLGRFQEQLGDRAVPPQRFTQPQTCVRTL
jgi:hypothetical protein